jgi:solute carrier family 35 (UDP-sugar transporter), member A1/2/3
LKLIVSYLFLRLDPTLANKATFRSLCLLLARGRKLIVLVLLYAVANIIPFYAINIIGAPIFTVVMQLKVFATAGFSSCMLGRVYSPTKWRALVLLVIGCILVSSPILNKHSSSSTTTATTVSSNATLTLQTSLNQAQSSSSLPSDPLTLLIPLLESYGTGLLGLLATLLQASISGFTSVYFEALLKDKDDDSTIWERNFQLAFYSLIVMTITVISQQILNDPAMAITSGSINSTGSSNSSTELFSNWTVLAVVIAIFQALGGLLVAGTLRYADSVLKCFATAVSIVLTSVVGYFFLENQVDFIVTLGYCVTIVSIFNYTLDATPTHPLGHHIHRDALDDPEYEKEEVVRDGKKGEGEQSKENYQLQDP